MPGIRWGKFSGRSRGAGIGGKGRKCEKSDSKDGMKCKESECMKKRGFWRSRCMQNPAADISFNIKARHNLKKKSLPEVEKSLDKEFPSLTTEIPNDPPPDCSILQEAELKKRVQCMEEMKQIVHYSEYSEDGIVEIGCLEDAEVTVGEEHGCMANVWLNGVSGERKLGDKEACNSSMPCTVGNHENVEHEGSKKAMTCGKAGEEDSLHVIHNKVAFSSCYDSDEIQEVDHPVLHIGTQSISIDDLSLKNRLQMVPNDFLCGMSKRIMEDPVVVASGQTFERASIQAWIDNGNTHCPITQKPLAHLQLIPNFSLKTLISAWFSSTSHGSGLVTAGNSFLSCMSSFSSCPSLMTCSDQKFVSCSSFSVSKLLEGMDLDSFSSSSSCSLPQLHSFTSSSTEHLKERHMHNHSSTPSSSGSSLCWEQDLCSSHEVEIVDSIPSTNSRQGESQLVLSKDCSLHNKAKDMILPSKTPLIYTMSRIDSLVSDLKSDYIDIQRNAAAELRLLAKHEDSNRILITRAGALKPLMTLLRSVDKSIQLDATTAVLNLSLNHTLKEYIVKEGAVEALVGVLRDGLSEMVKENAAVALAHLAVCEVNRTKIGSAGAIRPLTDLLERGSARGKKDAAAALYRVSSVDENKRRMVRAGALRPLVGFMLNGGGKEGMVDKAMAIVRNLVNIEEGRVAFVEEGGIMRLLQVIEVGSQRSRGLAVPILFQLCTHSSKHRSLVLQNGPLPTLMSISKTANSRLKMQVAEIIEVLIIDA